MKSVPVVGTKVRLTRKHRASIGGGRPFTGRVEACDCGLCTRGKHVHVVGMLDGRYLERRHVHVANLERAH